MTVLEKIYAIGHENILCTHDTTIEITKDKYLTIKGNCILGLNASKACYEINPQLKKEIFKGSKIKITINVGEITDHFYGYGDENLSLSDKKDIVFRKSNYICNRTIMINCTKSSHELNRKLIEKLKENGRKFSLRFELVGNNE